MDAMIDEVRGSTVFTSLDLFQGYWKIKMHESCREMTTCICGHGKFQFEVMPFGLKNSIASFQSMKHNLLANMTNVKCFADDDIINSAAMEENVKHLEKVVPVWPPRQVKIMLLHAATSTVAVTRY